MSDEMRDDLSPPAHPIWDADPVKAFELFRDRVCDAVQIVIAVYHHAIQAPSGAGIATVVTAACRESLHQAITDSQAIWFETPIEQFLDRSDGPVYLDESEKRTIRRASGSCYHDLALAVACGLRDAIACDRTCAEFASELRFLCAAGDYVGQHLSHLISRVRCEAMSGIERWRAAAKDIGSAQDPPSFAKQEIEATAPHAELRIAFDSIIKSETVPPLSAFLALGKDLNDARLDSTISEQIEGRSIPASTARGIIYTAMRHQNPEIREEEIPGIRASDEQHLMKLIAEIVEHRRWTKVRGELVKFSKQVFKELEERTPLPRGRAPSEPGTASVSEAKKTKKSTEPGEARVKIISALTAHHKYEADSYLNQEPIGVNALAHKAKVGKATVSRFFKTEFSDGKRGGHLMYRRVCQSKEDLLHSLKLLRGEVPPSILYRAHRNANELQDADLEDTDE
jgi:hypothetical protein